MSFLTPYLLFGLPLASLPIIIHLINRQRHRTLPWGAMMFLLDAKRLQRSMTKLRYWLILAMRVLAIAGLIFAISRPLATGWLAAGVGNQSDTVILLLDRSPSMEQTNLSTQLSKRATALRKFADLMQKTGDGKRIVMIESGRLTPEEIDVAQIENYPTALPSATSANIPAMIQAAADYLQANSIAQADIWVASDMRTHDWAEDDGRWAALRDSFAALAGVRFHLLSYAQAAEHNFSITVQSARRRSVEGRAELAVQFAVTGTTQQATESLSVEFLVNGVRSVLDVETKNAGVAGVEHAIPLSGQQEYGWGKVMLPADGNPADNEFYFVYGPEPVRRCTIISDNAESSRPLRLAAMAGPDASLQYEAVTLSSSRTAEIDWQATTCLIWQANLPTGTLAQQLDKFVASGRPVLCLPPDIPNDQVFSGQAWGSWIEVDASAPIGIGYWDNEVDLLAKAASGDALPVGKQTTRRYCQLTGSHKVLAKFTNDAPLLVRVDAQKPLYLLTTLPTTEASSLAEDGVVLYAMVQRAIEMGVRTQGAARNADAGTVEPQSVGLTTLRSSPPRGVPSSDFAYQAGCHETESGWLSINRATQEDARSVISDETTAKLFSGLDYQTIQDEVGSSHALANEIWRLFLLAMAVALIAEAWLCLL